MFLGLLYRLYVIMGRFLLIRALSSNTSLFSVICSSRLSLVSCLICQQRLPQQLHIDFSIKGHIHTRGRQIVRPGTAAVVAPISDVRREERAVRESLRVTRAIRQTHNLNIGIRPVIVSCWVLLLCATLSPLSRALSCVLLTQLR